MISRATVRNVIDKAELEYQKCWDVLCKLREGNARVFTVNDLLDFQPRLAQNLSNLDKICRALHQEKRTIIENKSTFNTQWFKHRLKLIQDYQDALKGTIAIGKSLGDAFAWIFYRKERKLLTEHLHHQGVFHTPPGIGGLGELEFVKTVKFIRDQLVIYHGTTSFLRIGDISLIDLKTWKVTAIGELKTSMVGDNEIEINVVMIGPVESESRSPESLLEIRGSITTSTIRKKLPSQIRQKLDRQAKNIVKSFSLAREKVGFELSTAMQSNINELSTLLEESKRLSISYRKVGDSQLVISVPNPGKRLLSRLLSNSKPNLDRKLYGIKKYAQQLVDPKSDLNSLIISDLHNPDPDYQLQAGMTPLFWWPLDLEHIRQILFHEVLLFSVYNPVHLVRKLRSAGFEVKRIRNENQYEVSKKMGDKIVEVHGFGYLMDLIMLQFFPEESVVELIENVASKLKLDKVQANTRVEFQIVQQLLL